MLVSAGSRLEDAGLGGLQVEGSVPRSRLRATNHSIST